jgi:23S rRNA pseudouridine2605 synthase
LATQRLQKVLSASGYGSRRDCEKLIAQNLVTINGTLAKLGDQADPERDKISVLGNTIKVHSSPNTYIIINKPINVLSDIKDDRGRKKVIDLVDYPGYLFIVGRLDNKSEGLILLTDDGEIANKLTHPRYEHQKEYQVLIHKKPSQQEIERLRNGVQLRDGYKTLPADVKELSTTPEGTWLKMTLKEGKKRQIREMGGALKIHVKRIIRTRIGPIHLGALKPGEWRKLSSEEIAQLKKSCSFS